MIGHKRLIRSALPYGISLMLTIVLLGAVVLSVRANRGSTTPVAYICLYPDDYAPARCDQRVDSDDPGDPRFVAAGDTVTVEAFWDNEGGGRGMPTIDAVNAELSLHWDAEDLQLLTHDMTPSETQFECSASGGASARTSTPNTSIRCEATRVPDGLRTYLRVQFLVQGRMHSTTDLFSSINAANSFSDVFGDVTLSLEVTERETDPQVSTGTSGEEQPLSFLLEQNYPNPFNPVTTIAFAVPEPSHVRIDVFDVLGRPVAHLVNERKASGSHTVSFDGSALPSGAYFYRMEAGPFTASRSFTLLK